MPKSIFRWVRSRGDADSGIALITVILWATAVSAIGALVAVSGVLSLKSTQSDRAATAAQGTTDAGIAEALSYIRTQGVTVFTCTEPLNPTSSTWNQIPGCGYNVSGANKWIDPFTPQIVSGGVVASSCAANVPCYQVWIGTLQKYQPAQGDQTNPSTAVAATPEVLRIHSTGFSGYGPGARAVTVDVTVTPGHFPIGVFSESNFNEQSSHIPVNNESIFIVGDVTHLDCPPTGLDVQYNIPSAVHAGGVIQYTPGNCHMSGDPTNPCTLADPYDQDSNGIALPTNSVCYNRDQTDPQFSSVSGTIKAYPQTTYFNANSLADYGYQPLGLTPSEYASLKEIAQSEGTYNVNGNALTTVLNNLVSSGVTSPVVYEDDGGNPDIGDFPSVFGRAPSTGTTPGTGGCTAYSVVVVVRGAVHITWQSNANLTAAVFAPEGTFEMRGTAMVIGTVFARNVIFNGDAPHFQLDSCFVASPPSGVMDVTTFNYNGTDTGNLQ